MVMTSAARRVRQSKPRIGSARWFRRYRAVLVFGWLAALGALLWVLLFRPDHFPAKPLALRSESGETKASPAGKLAMEKLPAVKLPADDAPHENATEWWYYSGHLQTDSGERYSFRVATFLRQGALAHTAFHGSLRDHQSGKHYTDQARTEGKPADGRRDGFGFSHGPWQITGSGPKHTVRMSGKAFAVDLALNDSLPPVLHQAPATPVAGLLDLGTAGWSYYTSRPRMTAAGSLSIDGVSKAVRGEVWFDHQWGNFEASTLRWNWFALQLAGGADLMLYELFDRQGVPVLRMGSYVKDGVTSALGAADFKASSRGSWKSKVSGVTYPMDWTIAVPSRGVDLKLEPVNRQSQFDARLTTLNVYWEGAVKISGSQSGVGFLELSGYEAASAAGKK
jgi:predicted secreted hydrolase